MLLQHRKTWPRLCSWATGRGRGSRARAGACTVRRAAVGGCGPRQRGGKARSQRRRREQNGREASRLVEVSAVFLEPGPGPSRKRATRVAELCSCPESRGRWDS